MTEAMFHSEESAARVIAEYKGEHPEDREFSDPKELVVCEEITKSSSALSYLRALAQCLPRISHSLFGSASSMRLFMLYHLGTMFITSWALGKAARRLGLWDTFTSLARSPTRSSTLRPLILLVLTLAQAGCVSTMTVREVQGSATVVQQGRAISARADLPLKAGDELQTEPTSTVILHFPGSDEVYVLPQTRVRIDSIFVFPPGDIFVRAKGRFAVKTEFATARVGGTEFWVSVDAKNTVLVGVFKGSVILESRTGLWRPVRVTRNEVFRIPQEQPPSKDPNPQDNLDRIRQLIEEIDKRRTRVVRKGGFFTSVAIGVVAGALGPLLPWPKSRTDRPLSDRQTRRADFPHPAERATPHVVEPSPDLGPR